MKFDILTPAVPTGDDPSPVGRYRNPRALPDGRLLVSWADGWVNDTQRAVADAARLRHLHLRSGATPISRTSSSTTTRTRGSSTRIPIAPRDEPPVIGSRRRTTPTRHAPPRIGSIDVKNTDLDDNDVTTVQQYAGGRSTSVGAPRGARRTR